MKKIIFTVIIMICAFMLVSCTSSGVVSTTSGGGSGEVEPSSVVLGWIDGNTFRVKAGGAHGGISGTISEKRSRSREKAVQKAQTTVIEKFIRDRVKRAERVLDPRSTGVSIINEFGKSVKNGLVFHEKYDVNNNVEIIYQVSAPDLKSKVEARGRQ